MTKKFSIAGTTRAERVKRFSELHVRHMKDRWAGKPFVLEPFQWENMILPVYGSLDRQGKRKHKRALYELPRWQGKSELTALLHLFHMYAEPVYGGEQYAVATTRQQAAIIFDTAKRMINADPLLRAATKVYRSVIEVVETGCTFRALPFDADTSQGYHASFASLDEIHVMKNMDMVDSMLSGMVGREEGLLVAISTAGGRPGNTLEQLKELWAKDPRAYIYRQGAGENDDPHDPATWRKANPASWITMDMLKSQYQALPLPVFQRLHLNITPTSGDNARAFNPKAWELCSDDPHIDLDKPCIIGVDAAPRRDKTAVVLDQRDENGVHHVKAWHFEADPEAGLLDFDELNREGLPVEDFPQHASRMIPASMNLYDLIQLGKVRHGNDPLLTKHVLNAGAKEIPPSGWRLTKVSKHEHIDAAVAMAMAAHIAESEWSLGGLSFSETGGVYSLDLSL